LDLGGARGPQLGFLALFALTLTLLGTTLLAVDGNSDCPEPRRVVERVSEILGTNRPAAFAERATLLRDGPVLVLSLTSPDGRRIGERRLTVEGDCETLASAAAVVLATWLGDEHPEFVAALPESPPPELAPPPAATTPTEQRASPSPAPARPRSAEKKPRSLPPRKVRRRLSAEAALGVSLASGEPAPLASLAVSWAPPATSGFGLSLSFQPGGSRRLSLGDGEVVWSRWPVAFGPLFRVAGQHSALELQAAAALGWLRIEGQGFETGREEQDLTAGTLARLQLCGRPGVFEPCAAAQATYWLKGAEVYTRPGSNSAHLPSFDLAFLVGIAVRP